ncbi:hypothetical protein QBC37DRAFT_386920 [Rhypophila decipiens]|uniref:Cell surface protein n=1 Tax=Rhypophila decipiens TaxID=261697 RepID=A0AAN7B8I0_9PEZI|nr:hypothetical protein QBC37DRAFT_386920 [Rhypophila decipiens]
MSGIINKVKDALHSDKSDKHSAPEGTAGPHSSRVANAADPRIDSDMDGSHNTGGMRKAGHGEYGSSGVGNTSSGMGGNTFSSSGRSEGATGPHNSRMANTLDPRVDSDNDGSRTVGGNTGTSGFGSTGTSGLGSTGHSGIGSTGHSGIGSTGHSGIGSTGHSGIGSTGHSGIGSTGHSGIGSTGHSGIGSTGQSGFGSSGNTFGGAGSGTTGMTGTHGPHSSRMANAADPRVDSDRDGRGALGHSAPGPASNTAGPHSSDMANKLDPRVDSDLDGSKTMGGNKTYQSGTTTHSSGLGRRDPTDAAQVPPSVLQQHLGEPTIEHEHKHDSSARRNSVKSHQERFSGI